MDRGTGLQSAAESLEGADVELPGAAQVNDRDKSVAIACGVVVVSTHEMLLQIGLRERAPPLRDDARRGGWKNAWSCDRRAFKAQRA